MKGSTYMKTSLDVIIAHNKPKAEAFLSEIEGKKPLFVATIATTETGKIPGLSAAGQNPDFTDFTPPADAELLLLRQMQIHPRRPHHTRRHPNPRLNHHVSTCDSQTFP